MNEQRVYLMTRLAIFEEEHKGQLESARGYFRSDYIGRQMIRSVLRATAAFILILCGWGLCNFDMLVTDITRINVRILLENMLMLYGIMLAVLLFLTYIIHSVRFARAEKDLEEYQKMLKELDKSYEEDAEKNRVRCVVRKG